MDEILGLIDSLEAVVLDGKKIPMVDKTVVEEKKLLNLIDKIRIVIKSEEDVVRKAIGQKKDENELNSGCETNISEHSFEARIPYTIIQEAEKESNKIKAEANSYADYILANLQLMVTKIQKNLITIEKSIEDGRDTLHGGKNEN